MTALGRSHQLIARRCWLTGFALLTAGVAQAAPPCRDDWSRPRALTILADREAAAAAAALPGGAAVRPGVDDQTIGALMFDLADIALIRRGFTAAELAPYVHQFRGDMMAAPATVPIGSLGGRRLDAAMNRRPDSPLPAAQRRWLEDALSPAGQAALAALPGAAPLDAAALAQSRTALGGFVAPVDPALPDYVATAGLAGTVSSVGSDGMKGLMDSWSCRFEALQPGVHAGPRWEHLGTLNGYSALLVGQAEMAPMGRELWPTELAAWQRTFPDAPPPTEIMVARGGYDTPQRTTAQAIFVNPANPIGQVSMEQLAGILGAPPTLTRWGQLGLAGAWADRPITIRVPPLAAPNAMSMQRMVLAGGAWNPAAQPAPLAATAQAILADEGAIGFGGREEGAPGLKVLAVAPRGGGDAVPPDAASASSGRYPLTRGMFIRLPPGPPSAPVREFLRFVLSRDGQARIPSSGYFPLSADEAARELTKLSTPATKATP